MRDLPQRHASIMLCHFPPNPGFLKKISLSCTHDHNSCYTKRRMRPAMQSVSCKQQKHKNQRCRQYMYIWTKRELRKMSIAHRILPRAEQQRRSLLSSSRRQEWAKGTRSDMRTKEEGRGWRREGIATELAGPMAVRSGGQWDAFAGL
jgi:hypothetical protein